MSLTDQLIKMYPVVAALRLHRADVEAEHNKKFLSLNARACCQHCLVPFHALQQLGLSSQERVHVRVTGWPRCGHTRMNTKCSMAGEHGITLSCCAPTKAFPAHAVSYLSSS